MVLPGNLLNSTAAIALHVASTDEQYLLSLCLSPEGVSSCTTMSYANKAAQLDPATLALDTGPS
ncbi:hypothetical protein IAQ61_000471 [Plenodomus lingam]|uniref:Predicted protein n=1 Tax=Leptosphaeria maculans (strain JN3 / isolate v23.1.3 / race Av1-4-5-6-7-8) TaxID=985895 RepID=E4ZRW9_LEPMJ|nr:predicted protein [Plenodomus lingam JN3]XP_003837596.1 predicted protein [Plenodomus lingam JN3]KAH9881743.1 hypothetical protein IAQ61_000471 [Plenodomus lingam]CBX94153.1 predicted protein [Plenodomus lingam JN3]CBX94156.1 predicted protein [Plenodomus lingam JN3]